ncbi:MAG: hypothetical protein NXI09_00040 [Bacteroidetes bacterium]|nr:hypothetical protein [Bacteroidota bacterium]
MTRFILIAIFPIYCLGQDSGLAEKILDYGIKDYQDGKYITALSHFNRSIALDSTNPKTYYFKGLTFLKGSRADFGTNISDSIKFSFSKTLELDSGFYPIAYRYLAGSAFFNSSEEAVDLIEIATKQDSSNLVTLILSVRIKHHFEKENIHQDLNRIVDLQPKSFQPYYIRGQYFFHTENKPEQAYQDFRKALRYATDDDLNNFESFYLTYYQILERTERFSKMKKLKRRNKITEVQLVKLKKYKYKIFEFEK